ncbi:hypothetical protein PCE1_002769 [Barthelona sp. PCE]
MDIGEPPIKAQAVVITCEICFKGEAKYSCPGCQLKYCSIDCFNEHKRLLTCDGTTRPERYIKPKEYDGESLHEDFLFLEDSYRQLESVYRNNPVLQLNGRHPSHLMKIQRYMKEHNCVMEYSPVGMTRTTTNTSRFKRGKAYLRCEFHTDFPEASLIAYNYSDLDLSLLEIYNLALKRLPPNLQLIFTDKYTLNNEKYEFFYKCRESISSITYQELQQPLLVFLHEKTVLDYVEIVLKQKKVD